MEKVQSIRGRALESRHAIELLSDKWRIALLHLLTPGPLRTSQLQRAIAEVSPKMLTQTLRGLERDGLIERRIFGVMPPRVEYQLTRIGESVIPLLRDLCVWAKTHQADRDSARKHFDAQSGAAKSPRPAQRSRRLAGDHRDSPRTRERARRRRSV